MSDCRLVNNITRVGREVKGAWAVGFPARQCHTGIRSAKKTAIWAWITLQSWRRPVHFLVMSIMARYSIFSRLSSVGNTDFVLVTLRSWRLNPSMALVV